MTDLVRIDIIFLRQVPMFANWGTIMFVISAVPLTKLVEVNNKALCLLYIHNWLRILATLEPP